MSALVSIVIPTHNRAGLLKRAVRSALEQSHPSIEVIVVDDGSTDNTPIALENLESIVHVRVVRHFRALGAAAARNSGARNARGDYVAFLDDDCAYRPDAIALMLEAIVSKQAAFAYCAQSMTGSDGREMVEGEPGAERYGVKGLLRRNHVSATGILVRRGLFLNLGGFDEALPRLQDWDLALRLLRHGSAVFVNEMLVTGRMIPGGISDNVGALRTAVDRMLARAEFVYGLSREEQASLCFGFTKHLLGAGEYDKAWEVAHKAVRLAPCASIAWLGVLFCLVGPRGAQLGRSLRHRMKLKSYGT